MPLVRLNLPGSLVCYMPLAKLLVLAFLGAFKALLRINRCEFIASTRILAGAARNAHCIHCQTRQPSS